MRVFHLIKGLGRGGAERLLVHLGGHFSNDIEGEVGYFLPFKSDLVQELADVGLATKCFGASSSAAMLFRVGEVARWLRARDADLLHCHLPVSGVVGRVSGRIARVPIVYTEHNLQERYHGVSRWLNRHTWRLQDAVVAVSSEVAGSIRASRLEGPSVHVIRNGIDVASFRVDSADARRSLGIPPDAPVVGTVTVFRVQKRLDRWLAAARRIRAEVPRARFLLVGDGPLRPETERQLRDMDLRDAVHLAGLQSDVVPYLAAMDVFLMTSDFEGLPLALLEAMASACAVVATPVGGIPEVVEEGVSGMLVGSREPADLARAVVSLLRLPERRCEMGLRARERVESGFGIERTVRELEAVYRSVLGG